MMRNDRQPVPVAPATDSHAAARLRVLETAERLFREYGYQKTAVADIARALGMSPANVYRFYESKRAIFEAVAINLLDVVERGLEAAVRVDGTAEQRLRALLEANHQLSMRYFVGDSRIRDMVAVAVNERWAAIDDHVERVRLMTEQIIRDGVAEGAFFTDSPATASACIMVGWLRFCHPLLIDEPFAHGPELDQMADFLIGALRAR
ncbi:TetR family transcriptional regulator [Camelimonas fluminis]|uniref:TetR/AcrR family transcriptional regulator n=1 Tax=Camelimonas fluminis TaxID=1576911 RepID=A0ABV7UD31_9HYPH|nr:TetR/AcrR family transcriptional regulator [Camelimonas fluminis]GHE46382.1 TetR family transcriptional regulator [Camelimonas fluminis]